MKIKISHNKKIISNNILVADSPLTRVIGLMFRKKPSADGLMIQPCNSIHTFFMRYPLDVIFIGRDNKVIKVIRDLKPWRMTWIYFKAYKTLELPAGNLSPEIKEGDILEVESV